MKSRVVFMALLCLLFIFTGAYAAEHPKVLNPTYNGQPQALFANPDGETWVYEFNGKWGETVPTATDAGEYQFNCSHKEESPATTCTGTIAKATLTITPNTDVRSKVYGQPDPAFKYSVTGLANGERIVTGNNFLSRESGEVVRTYDFKLGPIYNSNDASNKFNTKNYKDPVLAEGIQFEITKAEEAEITAPVAAEGLVYTGTSQKLLQTLAKPTDETATVVYQINNNTTKGNPTATHAGDYEIEYYIEADDNHEEIRDDSWKLTVTIAKANPKYEKPEPLDESTLSYTGSNLTLLKSIGKAIEPSNGRWIFFSTYTDPEGKTGEPVKFISTAPIGSAEGTYTITWYFYNNGNPENYNNGGSPENPLGTTTVTIAKDAAEIDKEPEANQGLKFNGNPQQLITAGESLQGTFKYFLEGEEEASIALPQGRDAGEYTVWYYVEGDDKYADNGSFDEPLGPITVNIAKIPARVNPAPTAYNDVYDSSEHKLLTYTGKPIGGTFMFKLDDGEYSEEIPTATNAGEYTITYYVKGDDNHTDSEEAELTAKINKIDPELVTKPMNTDPTYNGKEQELVTPGEYKGGTIMYFLMGDEPSEDVPTATNAGKYPVYYYVRGDENHNDLDVEETHRYAGVTSTIKPLKVTVIPNNASKVYGAEDPELTYTFDPASPVPGVTGNIDRNAGEDVGDYYFNLGNLALDKTSEGNFVLSFKDNDKDHLFSITKAAEAKVTAPVAKTGLVYNGKPQDLLETLASVEGDEDAVIVYKIGTPTTTGMPNAKDAGDYEIEYYIQADDNHDELHDPSWKLTVSIAKAPLTAVPNENQKKAYGDSDPDVYLFHFDGLVNREENNDAKWSGAIIRDEGKDAGFYGYKQGTLKLADDSNYTLTFDDQGVKFEITKVAPVITKNPAVIPNLVYTGEPKAIITAGEVEGGTMMYFVDGDEPSEKVPEKTNAGTYNVYFYVIGDKNHTDLDDTNHRYDVVTNATIAKAQVTVKPTEGQGKEYGAAEPAELTYTWTPETPKPEFTGALQRDALENVGKCYIRQGTLDLTEKSKVNFTMTFEPGVFEITQAKATLKSEPVGKTGLEYNGSYQELLQTLASTDDGTVHYVLDGNDVTTNPAAVPAGDYTVSYYIKGDDNHADNGSAAEPLGSVTVSIAKATVTLKPNAAEKVVGTDDPSFGWSSSGWKGDDESKERFTGKFSREEGEAIGEYAITQGTLALNDAMAANYNLTFVDGVLFTITPSQEKFYVTINGNTERQGYTGSLITMQQPFVLAEGTRKGILESDITCTGKVTGTDKETYTKKLNELGCTIHSKSYPYATLAAIPDTELATLIITEATITEDDFIAPTAKVGLVFNGSDQSLINPGQWKGTVKGTFVYSITEYAPKALSMPVAESADIPQGFNAGDYTVTWRIDGNDNFSDYDPEDPYLDAEIAQLNLESEEYPVIVNIDPKLAGYTEESQTAVISITVNGLPLVEDRDYEIENPEMLTQTEPGTYTVYITGLNPNVIGTTSVTWEIKDMVNRISMFRIGEPDKVCLRCGVLGGELPATGFPTRVNVPLAVKPQGLDYAELGMRIQIPSLNVDVELAGVPTMDGAWKVEWLADRAGLLSGTALPGDGYSIVAAHNTLNAEEVGPFVLLSTLQDNDTIFVNAPDGSMKLFRVYANELLAPNDMETLASIAEQESNTLVLVTCENESVDGGYLNRRVVFAKPLN